MIERPAPALVEALALLRAPRGPRLRGDERLPEGVLQLIRIAAGEEESLASATDLTREPAGTVREAAAFYIQQVLFAPGSDSFRVLGVNADAEDERVREHYRWLARWLHPDRNPDAWEVVFAERVSQAWQDLRTPERRLRYEQSGSETAPSPPESFRPAPVLPRRSIDPGQSTRRVDLRWLPKAILGSLGVCAVAGLALIVAVRMADERRAAERIAATSTAAPVREVIPAFRKAPPVAPMVESPPTPAPAELATLAPPTESALAAQPSEPEPLQAPAPSIPETPVTRPAPKPALAQAAAPVASVAPAAPVASPRASAPRESRPVTVSIPVAPARPPPATAEVVAVNETRWETRGSAVVATEARAVAAPAKIGTRDANRLINHFSRAYENGDLSGMRAMFANDARGPRGGVDEILSDYKRVFATSSERSLDVRDVTWFVDGETLTIIASFEATVTLGKSGRPRKTHGDLRLDLRLRNDQWQIYRLQHDEQPG